MKIFRRNSIVTVLLVLTLFSLSLFGCSTKSLLSPDDPVTLTMWHVYGEQADSPMNRLIEEFNSTVGQEKGIVISVTNVTSTSKISTQLLDAQAEKPGSFEMPDIFSCHTTTAVMLGTEHLLDWNEYFSQDELSDFVPEFLEDGTMEQRLTIFPVSKSTYALFINGSQFERFSKDTGVTYEVLSTWDGFFDSAQKYYEWSGGKSFCALDYLIRHIELDLLEKEGDVTYTENGWYDVTNEMLKDTWMYFAEALVQGHISVSDLYANTQVMTGETLAGIGSTAAIGYYNDVVTYPDNTSEPTNLHVLPLPTSGSGEKYMPQTGVGLAVYQTSDKKAEAASVFLHWFTEGERNLDFVAETGYMPVNNEAFDAIETYEFSDAGHASLYKAIHTMKNTYTPVIRPDFDGFYNKTDALYGYLRENQSIFAERLAKGDSINTLKNETWEFFCSIQ